MNWQTICIDGTTSYYHINAFKLRSPSLEHRRHLFDHIGLVNGQVNICAWSGCAQTTKARAREFNSRHVLTQKARAHAFSQYVCRHDFVLSFFPNSLKKEVLFKRVSKQCIKVFAITLFPTFIFFSCVLFWLLEPPFAYFRRGGGPISKPKEVLLGNLFIFFRPRPTLFGHFFRKTGSE